MRERLYGELVDWYRLIDPPADHDDEARVFHAAFERCFQGESTLEQGARASRPQTLLELGAGAGHNALHLKAHYRCTLVDLSPEMLALSRALNPECEHIVSDMRTLRLGRRFDLALIHDAIVYMTSDADLTAAVRTAYEHLAPGGVAIIAPDCLRETFEENTETEQASEGTRTVTTLMWDWDPDPTDDTFTTEYVFVMRDGLRVESVHDRHVTGMFSLATWRRILEGVGFALELLARPLGDGRNDEVFLCRKPGPLAQPAA
jgi:SAM-dependent methyltransferase